MTTLQTDFTEAELLETHPVAEPLIAGGVRCHGGFTDDGTYVSARWPGDTHTFAKTLSDKLSAQPR